MRALILMTSIAVLLLTGCKTYDADDYFNDALAHDNWSAASYAGYLNTFSENPLTQQNPDSSESIYRLLILQAASPVHMIKVRIESNNYATVSIKTTKGGYARSNGKKRDKTYYMSPSSAEISEFKNEMSKYDFWLQDKAPQYEFSKDLLTHPPMFLIEGQSGDQHVTFDDYDTVLRKNTANIILAFYKVADLDEEDDWTLSQYFSNFTKQDWTFKN